MAGRTASQTVTRYAGVQVQTSALGVNIPVGWGTFRCHCNLVDYLDFKSVPQKAAAAGKGGETTTGYSYSATIILAICEGPIDSIPIVYVDGKVYTNAAKTALQQANLNLSTGAVGQAVWSYLTSHHPDHAIGYSGLAIAFQSRYALDSGATPPNHSFEVVRTTGFGPVTTATGVDVDPSMVITDFFENSRYGVPSWTTGLLGSMTQYQDYCLAAGLVLSPLIDQQRSASDFLTEVLKATNSTCVWSEGVLKFIPYGDTVLTGNGKTYTPNDTPIYALTDDDFVQDSAGEPVLQVDIMDQSDAYNVVQLEYLDRTNQYNMAIALSSDAANVAQYGMRRKDPDTVHVICDPSVAAISSQLYLQRTLYIRAQYKFKLGWMFALLEPGDILSLTDSGLGLSSYPVRVIQIDEDEKYGLSFICEDYPIGVAHSPLYQMQTGGGFQMNQSLDPGGVEANLLLWSQDFTQGIWQKGNCTVGPNAAINDPYGGTSGQLMVSSASGVMSLYQQYNAGALPGRNFTFSIWLANGNATTANPATIFLQSSNGTTYETITVVPPNAAFQRYDITVLMGSGADNVINAGVILNTTASGQTLWVWGAQLNEGLDPRDYAYTGANRAEPILFNPPMALTNGVPAVWAAVAGGANWGGCNVWVSADGASFEQVGVIQGGARFGSLTSSLPSHADPDTTDSFGVDLGPSGGQLTSASSTTSADQGATLCLIDVELITFETATLTNPDRYTIGSYIRRGYLNTPIGAHSAGDLFVRLDETIFEFPFLVSNAGETFYVKFQSFNHWGNAPQPLENCLAYQITPDPVASAAPVAGGDAIPAIIITGACENPQATALLFFERTTGATTWNAAGANPPSTTKLDMTGVPSATACDVGIAYLVGGIETAITVIGAGITTGATVAASLAGQGPLATSTLTASQVQNSVLAGQLTAGSVIPAQSVVISGQGGLATMNTVGSTTGTIDSGGVGTTQLAANAVTNAVTAFTASGISVNTATPVQSVTITVGSNPVQILAEFLNTTGQYAVTQQLFRGSTLLWSGSSNFSMPIMLSDTPGAGTYTYYLYGTSAGTGNTLTNRFLSAMEIKR